MFFEGTDASLKVHMKKREDASARRVQRDYTPEEFARRKARYLRRKRAAAIRRIKATVVLSLLIACGSIGTWEYVQNNQDTEEIILANTPNNESVVVIASNLEDYLIETRVSFLAVGDNLGHMTVNNYADRQKGSYGDGEYDYLPLYANVSDIIAEVDLAFINQETMITGDERGISGYPLFNSPEAWARDVVELGFDIVNAASNHTLDKGFSGVEGAAEIWSQYDDITYVGAYTSQEDADTIRLIEREGITFAVLAYTYGTNGIPIPNDFCVFLLDEEKIKSDVAKAKEISDVVIVSSHWGDEGSLSPNDTQKKFAQVFADAEVDIVVGHHSHTVQPITWVEGENGNETLVVYGLGNFISTMTSVDNQLEIMLTLDFVKKGEEVTIENIVAIPMVNHYDTNGATEVYFLEDYTSTLVSRHRNLSGKMTDVLGYYDTKLNELIPEEYLGTVGDARSTIE